MIRYGGWMLMDKLLKHLRWQRNMLKLVLMGDLHCRFTLSTGWPDFFYRVIFKHDLVRQFFLCKSSIWLTDSSILILASIKLCKTWASLQPSWNPKHLQPLLRHIPPDQINQALIPIRLWFRLNPYWIMLISRTLNDLKLETFEAGHS